VKTARNFIDFLKRQGVIDDEKAASFDSIWRARFKFGIIALREGMIGSEQLFEVLEEQALKPEEGPRIGELMQQKGFMSLEQVNEVLLLQEQKNDAPAEIFVDAGLLPAELVAQKLEEFLNEKPEDK